MIYLLLLVGALVGCKNVPVVAESPDRIVSLNIKSPEPLDLQIYKEKIQFTLLRDENEVYYLKTSLESFNATIELLRVLGYRIEVLEVTLDQYRNFYEPKEVK